MEVKKAIIDRHSIRGFTSEPVSKEVVEDILKTAGYAVSSKNTQPVRRHCGRCPQEDWGGERGPAEKWRWI